MRALSFGPSTSPTRRSAAKVAFSAAAIFDWSFNYGYFNCWIISWSEMLDLGEGIYCCGLGLTFRSLGPSSSRSSLCTKLFIFNELSVLSARSMNCNDVLTYFSNFKWKPARSCWQRWAEDLCVLVWRCCTCEGRSRWSRVLFSFVLLGLEAPFSLIVMTWHLNCSRFSKMCATSCFLCVSGFWICVW